MGAYCYCQNCGRGLDQPTLREEIAEYTEPSCGYCGADFPNRLTDREIMAKLLDKIEELEERLNRERAN